MNAQLLRTNTLIGGQVKWDLIVEPFREGLVVSGFYLSPVSPYIPFNRHMREDLLNYGHSYNLRHYFQKVKGYFWSAEEDPSLKGPWPYITSTPVDSHCSIYEAGARRADYGLYSKQFECLCPLWLETLPEDQSLQLAVQIYATAPSQDGSPYRLSSKVLDLREREGAPETHNRFCRYFRTWLNEMGITAGNSDVISISLEGGRSWIRGVDVTSGDLTVRDISNINSSLLYRQRPMMETDSIITDTFRTNKVIAAQLINLSVHFNTEDILPGNLCRQVYGSPLSFRTEASVQDLAGEESPQALPLRDFFSNYDYIPREMLKEISFTETALVSDIGWEKMDKANVLDWLGDSKALLLMRRNRMVQGICHWALNENPDYIFNLYGGWSAYQVDKGDKTQPGVGIYSVSHGYGAAPDPGSTRNAVHDGIDNASWATLISATPAQMNGLVTPGYQWMEGEEGEDPIYEIATTLDSHWIGGLKHAKDIYESMGPDASRAPIYKICLVHVVIDEDAGDTPDPRDGLKPIVPGETTGWNILRWAHSIQDHNLIYFLSSSTDALTYGHIRKALTIADPFEGAGAFYLEALRVMMYSLEEPSVISFSKSLRMKKAAAPSLRASEIAWEKDDAADPLQEYVIRYDGRISPSLIPAGTHPRFRNFVFYKDQIGGVKDESGTSPLERSVYARYSNTGFVPEYPSISYYSLRKVQESYDSVPEAPTSSDGSQSLCPLHEWPHFNASSLLALIPSTDLTVEAYRPDGTEFDPIEPLAKEALINGKYGIDPNSPLGTYIWSLYEISYSFDYDYSKATEEDPQAWKDNYIYNVKAQLR